MINEYLFLSGEKRAEVEAYEPEGIEKKISDIENTSLWVAKYSTKGMARKDADKLSAVHTTLMQYSPLVLQCESSAYYNKMLFPLANELERKLRDLLYFAASISNHDKAKENIKQLEEKDFGEIFDMLFIDKNFITGLKTRINADEKGEFRGRSKYSKAEITLYLNNLEEHALWDRILDKEDVKTLREKYRAVQTYRNDVMHAHNIEKRTFEEAKELFETINRELDDSINKQRGSSKEGIRKQNTEVNSEISSALAAMASASALETSITMDDLPGLAKALLLLARVSEQQRPSIQSIMSTADAISEILGGSLQSTNKENTPPSLTNEDDDEPDDTNESAEEGKPHE